jgi:flagellar motility protein MotE (MotC chaperone)
MGFGAPAPSINPAKTPPPQPQTVVAQAPVKAAEAVKAAIFDTPAQAAQQAPAPASEKKAPQQAQPESVLSIQQLKTRAEALDRQEQALKTMEADLNARVAKLQELETMLKGMLSEAKSIKEEKMRHLIDVYTNMKPKQAASVLETLDETIAVKILAGMKGRTAGEILTGVSAKKAAKLSEELTKLQIGPDLPEKP